MTNARAREKINSISRIAIRPNLSTKKVKSSYCKLMGHILCIEDSNEFQILLRDILVEHKVTFVGSLKAAQEKLDDVTDMIDLILLDLTLPDGSGIFLLQNYVQREAATRAPIIVMTADSEVNSKVLAFQIGADDYICKPFDVAELRARIDSKLRGHSQRKSQQSSFAIGDLILDLIKMQVLNQVTKIPISDFTPLEFKLLLALSRPLESTLSRGQLIHLAWNHEINVSNRTVDAHISHVRKKIESSQVRIRTVPGIGYQGYLLPTEVS